MALGFLKVVVVGTLGVSGVAGAVYWGSKAFSSSSSKEQKKDDPVYTFRDKFSGRLVTAIDIDDKWKSRLDKLTQERAKESRKMGLPEARDQKGLHKWCEDTSDIAFDINIESIFESYCVLMNKEQISKGLIQKDGVWKEANERLGKIEDSNLSEELRGIRDQVKANATSAKELETWCVNKYDLPFKGSDDKDFLYIGLYCVVEEAKPSAVQSPPSGP